MDKQTSEAVKENKTRKIVFTAVSAVLITALAVFLVFSVASKLKESKQSNLENGYTDFQYAKELKVNYASSQECSIGGNTYYLMNRFRPEYIIENKGSYNEYGFFFGEAPDFHMMNYDSSSTDFWYMNAVFRYPEIAKDRVVSLIVPDIGTSKSYGNPANGIVRVNFGTSPVRFTDTAFIENAVNEYKENRQYRCAVSGVPAGTPIYAEFENSCLYLIIGYTAEE